MHRLPLYLLIVLFSLAACCECIDGGDDSEIHPYSFSSENFEECGLSGIYLAYQSSGRIARIELRNDGIYAENREIFSFWSGRFDCKVITLYSSVNYFPTSELEVVEISGDSLVLIGGRDDEEIWIKQ